METKAQRSQKSGYGTYEGSRTLDRQEAELRETDTQRITRKAHTRGYRHGKMERRAPENRADQGAGEVGGCQDARRNRMEKKGELISIIFMSVEMGRSLGQERSWARSLGMGCSETRATLNGFVTILSLIPVRSCTPAIFVVV